METSFTLYTHLNCAVVREENCAAGQLGGKECQENDAYKKMHITQQSTSSILKTDKFSVYLSSLL